MEMATLYRVKVQGTVTSLILLRRAQKKLHPYHPVWKTISNLRDNFGQKQRKNRLAETAKQPARQTDRQTDRQTVSIRHTDTDKRHKNQKTHRQARRRLSVCLCACASHRHIGKQKIAGQTDRQIDRLTD